MLKCKHNTADCVRLLLWTHEPDWSRQHDSVLCVVWTQEIKCPLKIHSSQTDNTQDTVSGTGLEFVHIMHHISWHRQMRCEWGLKGISTFNPYSHPDPCDPQMMVVWGNDSQDQQGLNTWGFYSWGNLSDKRWNVFKNLKEVQLPPTQALKNTMTWITESLHRYTALEMVLYPHSDVCLTTSVSQRSTESLFCPDMEHKPITNRPWTHSLDKLWNDWFCPITNKVLSLPFHNQ